MATGGVEADGLVTCSICLEPYRGREPKLLPCLHTFCLPCLTKLVTRKDAAQTPGTAGPDTEEEEGGGSAHSLTCPTCRRVTPLPPGGVAGFQKNIYLDSSSREEEEDPQPAPCTLCDGDHTAQVHCRQCQNNVCSQCRRYHDKLCRGGQVRALQDPSDSSSSSTAQKPSHGQVRQQQQLQRVGEAVKKLGEEERKLKQEREAMDHSINARYANMLCRAADARDACKQSLREACDGLTVQLHSSMAEARHAQDTLQRQLSPSQPAPVATAQQRAALFLQGELQAILDRDLDTCSLLRHHTEDNPSLMTSLLHAFMGNVVKSSQVSAPAQSKLPSGSLRSEEDHGGAMSSAGAGAKNLDDLHKKVEDLVGQVTSLHSTNTQLSQHVTVLSNANSKLATDQSSLQREVTTLKDKNATLTKEQAVLQREVTAMRDKHAIVHQDLAVLTTEKDNACAQLTKLQTDLTSVQTRLASVQTDTSRQQTDILQLKADHGDVLAKFSTVQTDMTALQGDQSSMKKDMTALQGDQSSMKKDMTALQRDQSSMKKDMTALQGDRSSMKKDMTALQGEQKNMKRGIDQLKTSGGKLKSDMQMAQRKLTSLESRFTTANTQVGFHAWLGKAVTTSQEQILTCDLLFSNEGGGYDKDEGVFTAPLTGIYCFLATTSPNEPDVDKKARLDIIVDDVRKGYMFAMGNSWSSGHCVVKVRAGQRVWLRTYADGNDYTFGDGGWTFFSGALLQAEV